MAVGAWRIGAGLALLSIAALAGAARREPPYWVSISASAAMLRTGPGTNFPATWRYVRPGLPLRVVQLHADWRRVVDPDGAEGWIRSNLLSDQRTGMVIGGIQPLYARPDSDSRIEWRAEPGVVGRVTSCDDGWCRFDVQGRVGYVDAHGLWGVAPNETFN
jgi:SH3-like domain-containing protein